MKCAVSMWLCFLQIAPLAKVMSLYNIRDTIAYQDKEAVNFTSELQPPNFNESLPACMPWAHLAGSHCTCSGSPYDIIRCPTATTPSTLLQWNCITYNEDLKVTEAGLCIYPCRENMRRELVDPLYTPLPKDILNLTDFMCGAFKRTGTLCGQCMEGYYPMAHSFNMSCIECENGRSNLWKFVLASVLPVTIFYFVILFLNINITSSNLHGFVFCIQVLTVAPIARALLIVMTNRRTALTFIRIIGSIYAVWNLDFLRFLDLKICLPLDTIETMALDFVIGIYPLMLMVLTYFLIRLHDRNFQPIVSLWKPFRAVLTLFRRNWDINTSVIDAFAAFFLLSYVKFLSVSFDVLTPVKVYQLNSTGHLTQSWRLYYDASLPYFGDKHLPIAFIAITLMTAFSLLPFMIVAFYPFRWFQSLLNAFPVRWYILHTFVDSFHGCFKDGTQPGTRDCRWFAALFLFVRFLLAGVGIGTLGPIFYMYISISLVVLAILLVIVQPFKTDFTHYSDINTISILLLAMMYISITGFSISEQLQKPVSPFFYVISGVVGLLPLLYMSTIILHWIYKHRKFGQELIRKLVAWRQGYNWWSLE